LRSVERIFCCAPQSSNEEGSNEHQTIIFQFDLYPQLAAFIEAVTELFGLEQARLSAEDWLDESELMDSPPRSTSRDWRAVTVAASARLASRLTVASHHRTLFVASIETKVSAISSSN
jgi:hypothetical protein